MVIYRCLLLALRAVCAVVTAVPWSYDSDLRVRFGLARCAAVHRTVGELGTRERTDPCTDCSSQTAWEDPLCSAGLQPAFIDITCLCFVIPPSCFFTCMCRKVFKITCCCSAFFVALFLSPLHLYVTILFFGISSLNESSLFPSLLTHLVSSFLLSLPWFGHNAAFCCIFYYATSLPRWIQSNWGG